MLEVGQSQQTTKPPELHQSDGSFLRCFPFTRRAHPAGGLRRLAESTVAGFLPCSVGVLLSQEPLDASSMDMLSHIDAGCQWGVRIFPCFCAPFTPSLRFAILSASVEALVVSPLDVHSSTARTRGFILEVSGTFFFPIYVAVTSSRLSTLKSPFSGRLNSPLVSLYTLCFF